ncbi:LysR family transcriptional regulator [Oleidesulfovibrio sp.]|uniref:LysR family transcriptional regulator n=1 Tax=Oleidesulfovibrio sp. TaxID=2909707 RepID=UPI003A8824C4
MINLEWLRTFKTVYEKGSMTAAAEALFVSQPGVSLHLGSLEEHVGYKLFERAPRKLIPTERGKLLYNGIIDPILKLEAVEQHIQQTTRQDRPTIVVGMCFETFQETLEKHVHGFAFDLILEFGNYDELLKKLEKGLIDIVVTPEKRITKGVRYRPVSQANIILAAGKGQNCEPMAELKDEARKEDLLVWLTSQKWYGIAGDSEHLKRFWKVNFNAHPDFRPNYIVPNIHSVARGLSAGPGLAVIPDFLCRKAVENADISILWKGYRPVRDTLYVACRTHSANAAQLAEIEDLLKKELPPLDMTTE